MSYARILMEVDITQKLCEEISIRDHTGQKKKQKVEYEWRPQFFERCQKVGHVCNKEKKVALKNWQPKPAPNVTEVVASSQDKESVAQREVKTPSQDEENVEVQSEGRVWTEVGKRNREHGKKAITEIFEKIRKILGSKWCYIDNYSDHNNGRIWILRDEHKVDVRKIKSTHQMVHCDVYKNGDFLNCLTAVYADNKLEERKKLWKHIENIGDDLQGPWSIMGDFNNVLCSTDKIGGRLVKEYEYSYLIKMMEKNGLYEMESKGDKYTWFNNHVDGAIYSRIDRVIANVEWLQQNNHLSLYVMGPNISDHSLLCLKGEGRVVKKRNFKFLNMVTELEGYNSEVEKNWRNKGTLWTKLSRLQHVMRKFSRPLIDEQIARQRSKIAWIRLGDGNNSFFHASLRSKQKLNMISRLHKDDGTVAESQQDIEEEVLRFYGSLMGNANTSIEGVDINHLRKGD
ncbi:uncharacterized protein LOC131625599 [Vicia villosa]|uniref:uncharacterized protein LOC131625599 n=1 Tax=Vicia villosa TaxID=3911 RepID=UPI00273AA02D|nr:uncharacterized protein LOC131625599 [Vicia villosa]